jgi:uncharacterized protein
MELEATCVGRVRHVLGSTITVALDPTLAGVQPMWRGRLIRVGQVGSLVRFPQGPVSLLGAVALVGISELTRPLTPSFNVAQGDRWLQVQLLGEVDPLGNFQRGVTSYPALDDPVHFTVEEDLTAIFPRTDANHVELGALSAAPTVTVTLNAGKLVTRHAAIVGSTGAGKTSSVASLIQSFVRGGWSSSNIVVIDPHGEYAAALSKTSSTKSVLAIGEEALRVPYWALPAASLLKVLTGLDGRTVTDRFSELVKKGRQSFAESASWLNLDKEFITADTPIPFDLREVWYQIDFENRATYTEKTGGSVCVEKEGDPTTLKPARFIPYGPTKGEPVKGVTYDHFTPAPERLRARLDDPKFAFFLDLGTATEEDPLIQMLHEWLGGSLPVSVLDFSGVQAEVADVAIGVVLQLLFEVALRSTDVGIGRPRPVLIVLEEAHRYLGSGATSALAREVVNRISREGRKYGVGVILVTQRPSELPDTALAQCGTIIALRLTNQGDQGTVRAALPDAVAGLADALPSLKNGEALVSGEAVTLPSRALIRRPEPEPQAADPTLEGWRISPAAPNQLDEPVRIWRDSQPR